MDMVCTKTNDSKHNFNKDPLELIIDVDKNIMEANETTLGADNGIGLVTSMLVAEKLSNNKENIFDNRALYLLFTADEESGLEGAQHLQKYPFLPQKAYVINVDSEIYSEICGASAGASDSHITFELNHEFHESSLLIPPEFYFLIPSTWNMYTLKIYGLKGGHSGVDIHKGAGNAIKMITYILANLRNLSQDNLKIHNIEGGNAHNAIPIESSCTFSIDNKYNIYEIVVKQIESIKTRFNEDKVEYSLLKLSNTDYKLYQNSDKIIDILMLLDQGIIHMNPYSEGCVDTSTNIGTVKTIDNKIVINCLSRSSNENSLKEYYHKMELICKLYNATIDDFEHYPGWNPDWNTNITLKALKETYLNLYGKEARVYSCHAGLETSELQKIYPYWTSMSIGPTIQNAHTYHEYVELDTIEPFYQWLYHTVIKLVIDY